MFYAQKLYKNGNKTYTRTLNVDSLDKAKIAVAQEGKKGKWVIADDARPPSIYEEVQVDDDFIKKFVELGKRLKLEEDKNKIQLSERAQKVIKNILPDIGVDLDDAIQDNYSVLGLLESTDKSYYAYYYWNYGFSGCFCDRGDVIDTIGDIVKRSPGDSYSFLLYDVETGKQLEWSIKDISITLPPELGLKKAKAAKKRKK